MSEYDSEPIPGLPGFLPPGEDILWQGSPDWRALARTAFHTRLIAAYFVVLTAWALIGAVGGGLRGPAAVIGVAMTVLLGAAGVGLLHLLAWASARSTIYTLTNRRIVMRIGVAVPKCINLPLAMIGTVGLAARGDDTGDIPLTLVGVPKLGFFALWPHARPWKVVAPQPMLRSVPGAAAIAATIARTCLAAHPDGRIAAPDARATAMPVFAEAAAA